MSRAGETVRSGFARGGIELRHTFTTSMDVWNYLLPAAILTVVMIFMRDSTVEGTSFSLGSVTMPGALGVTIAFGGLSTLVQVLTIEREDGTLLRAKAIPNGMVGYLIGKIVLVSGMTAVGFTILLVPGLMLFDGFALGLGSWLTLAWVAVLGLAATLPIGAILGSLFANPRNAGLGMLVVMGLVAVSGVFYPLASYPEWLRWIGQSFPIYWTGLGMRSALLPDELAMVEIGQSWRHLETVGVLAAWTVAGMIVAPAVLRRMARRESGSSVAARRERALRRIT